MKSPDTLLPIHKLDAITFDTLLKRHNPFQSANRTFDLTGVQFITSSALVQLAAACHCLGRDGRQTTIIVDNHDQGVTVLHNHASRQQPFLALHF